MSTSAIAVPLAEYLETRRKSVDAALNRWLPTSADCPNPLAEAMRYAVFPGGKRLRSLLVLLACESCEGEQEAAMPAACAVELVHCYSLVHDDLPAMDDDDLRRGRPSCHKAFGEALGILAGDALLTLAFEVLARHCQTPGLAAGCCRELALAAGACGMVGGQVDDLAAGHRGNGTESSTESCMETLQSLHARKTGALLKACVRTGGLAAGAGVEEQQALEGYGTSIGLAFQITDDLLDVRGAESNTGKRVGKDVSRGKLTYPALVGVERSGRMVRELCRTACEALAPLGDRAERLKQLARFIVERDR